MRRHGIANSLARRIVTHTMSARKTQSAGQAPPAAANRQAPARPITPRKKNAKLLLLSVALLVGWLVFLARMAFR